VDFIILGAVALAAGFLNERYGDQLPSSSRGQLTETERRWMQGREKERRTLVLVVVGALLLFGGIVSLLVQAVG
jgi:hypothetical protein